MERHLLLSKMRHLGVGGACVSKLNRVSIQILFKAFLSCCFVRFHFGGVLDIWSRGGSILVNSSHSPDPAE